jgi:hypothetical protein
VATRKKTVKKTTKKAPKKVVVSQPIKDMWLWLQSLGLDGDKVETAMEVFALLDKTVTACEKEKEKDTPVPTPAGVLKAVASLAGDMLQLSLESNAMIRKAIASLKQGSRRAKARAAGLQFWVSQPMDDTWRKWRRP